MKPVKVDGLGPEEVKRIRAAIRQVWHWSHAKRLVVKRCARQGGYAECEKCRELVPKVYIDHIEAVGALDAGFIARLFCPSTGLQGLCKECHNAKTKWERQMAALLDD